MARHRAKNRAKNRATSRSAVLWIAAPLAAALALSAPAQAQRGASCHGGQSFDQFLAGLKRDAAAETLNYDVHF